MSNRVTDMRAVLLAAIKAVAPGVEVLASGSAKACFNRISRKRSLFAIYGGWSAGAIQIAAVKTRQGYDTWYISAVVESYRSAEDAFNASGGADDLLEAVHAMTGTFIGGVNYPTVNIRLTGVALAEGDLATDAGGTWGYVATYETNEYRLL